MSALALSTDAALACAARAGARESFDELVERHATRLYRFLRMRAASPTDVDDLLQDTFLLCWQKLALYDPARPFTPWLFKLAANLATTRTRRHRALEDADLDTLPGGADPADVVADLDARGNLWDIVHHNLPPQSRTALWLFYGEGQSATAVAEILGKSEGAVRILLFRARASLHAALATHTPAAST